MERKKVAEAVPGAWVSNTEPIISTAFKKVRDDVTT
jgi:hypothetical protein